jgi:hypothetical protein
MRSKNWDKLEVYQAFFQFFAEYTYALYFKIMQNNCYEYKMNEYLGSLLVVKLEAQWTEPVSLTFHSALRKLNTELSIGDS